MRLPSTICWGAPWGRASTSPSPCPPRSSASCSSATSLGLRTDRPLLINKDTETSCCRPSPSAGRGRPGLLLTIHTPAVSEHPYQSHAPNLANHTSDSSVARAPHFCSEASADRYAETKGFWSTRSPNTSRLATNASGPSYRLRPSRLRLSPTRPTPPPPSPPPP